MALPLLREILISGTRYKKLGRSECNHLCGNNWYPCCLCWYKTHGEGELLPSPPHGPQPCCCLDNVTLWGNCPQRHLTGRSATGRLRGKLTFLRTADNWAVAFYTTETRKRHSPFHGTCSCESVHAVTICALSYKLHCLRAFLCQAFEEPCLSFCEINKRLAQLLDENTWHEVNRRALYKFIYIISKSTPF